METCGCSLRDRCSGFPGRLFYVAFGVSHQILWSTHQSTGAGWIDSYWFVTYVISIVVSLFFILMESVDYVLWLWRFLDILLLVFYMIETSSSIRINLQLTNICSICIGSYISSVKHHSKHTNQTTAMKQSCVLNDELQPGQKKYRHVVESSWQVPTYFC